MYCLYGENNDVTGDTVSLLHHFLILLECIRTMLYHECKFILTALLQYWYLYTLWRFQSMAHLEKNQFLFISWCPKVTGTPFFHSIAFLAKVCQGLMIQFFLQSCSIAFVTVTKLLYTSSEFWWNAKRLICQRCNIGDTVTLGTCISTHNWFVHVSYSFLCVVLTKSNQRV